MKSRQRLYLLFFLVFIFQMGFGIVTPVLSLYADSFELGAVSVGWVIAIYGLARVIVDIPALWLAQRIGNPYAMAVGAICLSAGSLLCGLADSYGWLLVFRFIAGAGSAITLVIGQSMVAVNPAPYSRAKAFSYYQGFFLAGVSLGPMLGGVMAELLGMRTPFFAYAGLAFLVAVMAMVLLQRAEQQARSFEAANATPAANAEGSGEGHVSSLRQSLAVIARDVPFLLISLLTLLQHFTRTGGINGIVPLHGAEHLLVSASQIGYVMGIAGVINLAVVFITGGLSDRWGRKTLIVPASILIAMSLAVFAFAQNFGWFILGSVLWGLGAGISGPVSAAYVTDRVKGNQHGSAMALYRMLSDIGYITGPLLLGLVSEWSNMETALLMTAVLFILCTWIFNRYSPETTKPLSVPLNHAMVNPTKEQA